MHSCQKYLVPFGAGNPGPGTLHPGWVHALNLPYNEIQAKLKTIDMLRWAHANGSGDHEIEVLKAHVNAYRKANKFSLCKVIGELEKQKGGGKNATPPQAKGLAKAKDCKKEAERVLGH